jgi:hypothetical protein
MAQTYDEDRLVQAATAIRALAVSSAPDEPRIQLETILLAAVAHALQQLGMPREEVYRSLMWLLIELERKGSDKVPTLTLVP